MSTILVKNGIYRNHSVTNVRFPLIKGFQTGAKGGFVTVDSNGYFGPDYGKVRIKVQDINDIEYVDGESMATQAQAVDNKVIHLETDEEVMERIGTRFSILNEMTKASINGDVRAMIVVGPPGVGKSFGVQEELEKASLFDTISSRRVKHSIIKGAMTPIGLYCTLYNNSDANNVIVFDDCDSVLMDDLSLNILKAALDSGKKRRIYWNADSSKLRNEGIPDNFDFKGSAIFITNIKFENVRSKKLQDHLEALQSRCHYLDLTLDTMRDKFLRIKQIFRDGDLFRNYDFSQETGDEILTFMDENKDRLREMSLRMALKIADLTKVSSNWKALAESTCMRHG